MNVSSFRARVGVLAFGVVVTLTDLLPPRVRYGYVHRISRAIWSGPLPSVPPLSAPASERAHRAGVAGVGEGLTCVLLTDAMDVGGIGSVVEVLASELRGFSVRPVIICAEDGVRARRLRDSGVDVRVADSEEAAQAALRELAPAVIELHGAPKYLEDAAIASGVPLVPVLHNTEIHYTRARWKRFRRVLESSPSAIAVSETVRRFHVRHVGEGLGDRVEVVANSSHGQAPPTPAERRAARDRLGDVVGRVLDDDQVVFVCLARYDAQKNIAGLVSSFVTHVADSRVHLVVAGEPSDWAEYRRADAIRRASDGGSRVSLLGPSDATSLLASADAFVLDSFFEGWPVAATEAASAGLPLILADFGGAHELVSGDADRSLVISNACGAAASVSDRAVARARRATLRQTNAVPLARAIETVAGRVQDNDGRVRVGRTPTRDMARGHAEVIHRVGGSRARVQVWGGSTWS